MARLAVTRACKSCGNATAAATAAIIIMYSAFGRLSTIAKCASRLTPCVVIPRFLTGDSRVESIEDELKLLREAVRAAFAGAEFPGDRPGDIVEDIFGERERLAPLFLGKKWEDWLDNPLGMFAPHPFCGGLSFMDPDAFRYYLPVLLMACTAQRKQSPNLVAELVRILIRPEDESRQFWYGWAIGKMTKPQHLAVIQALDFLDNHYAPHSEAFHKDIGRARHSIRYYLTPHSEPAS